MNTTQAIQLANEWVTQIASHEQGFKGAYLAGSIIGQAPTSSWPSSSDVDIMVVSTNVPPYKLGKFTYKNCLLEVTHLDYNLFQDKGTILADYHLSYSFAHTTILADKDKILLPLQKQVVDDFTQLKWVNQRCLQVKHKIRDGLTTLPTSLPFHEQVMNWLFPTGVLTHLFLTADLQNPTVRKRYVDVKPVLTSYKKADVYEQLLDQLCVSEVTRSFVQSSLEHLTVTFDLAVKHGRTPFFFSTDISKIGRPIAIDGSEALIHANLHRESLFWIIATFCRCQIILAKDAPHLHQERLPYFHEILAKMGIEASRDLRGLADGTMSNLEHFWKHTEDILAQNPRIKQ
ncbi:hypothetical protein ACE1TH_09795 [Shouchella sp. JSM 1781072]|uniref:hypothetical protein n=1 Tax=Shouchella sp. JSM 1781072 TaxID=3344581 RepID=UPI0035C14A65